VDISVALEQTAPGGKENDEPQFREQLKAGT